MERLRERFPHLQYGYFNPTRELYAQWREGRADGLTSNSRA